MALHPSPVSAIWPRAVSLGFGGAGRGSIRRERIDHVVVIGERHLREILSKYVDYYNQTPTQSALTKDTPEHRTVRRPSSGRVVEVARVGGLHREYLRRAA